MIKSFNNIKYKILLFLTVILLVTVCTKPIFAVDKGSVKVTLIDPISKDKLEGGVFQLQDTYGNPISDNHTTNDKGFFILDNLEPGRYLFKQTKAPTGYLKQESAISFVIVENQTSIYAVVFLNERITSKINITSVDKDTRDKLGGSIFKLVDESGQLVSDNHITNEQGQIEISDVTPGTYKITQTKAPEGYVLNNEVMNVIVNNIYPDTYFLVFENIKDVGGVNLNVIDSVTGKGISNAEFTLRYGDGSTISEGHLSDSNGQVIINGLFPGEYQLIQTKAPVGYEINNNVIDFTIIPNQTSLVSINFKNVKISNNTGEQKPDQNDNDSENKKNNLNFNDKLPKTGTSSIIYIIIGLFSSIGSLAIIKYRN